MPRFEQQLAGIIERLIRFEADHRRPRGHDVRNIDLLQFHHAVDHRPRFGTEHPFALPLVHHGADLLGQRRGVAFLRLFDPRDAVERELLLVTVAVPADVRGQVIELVNVFEGRILNVGHDRLTLSLEGHPDKLDDFEELLRPYGIVELQRSGRVALPKIDNTTTRLRPARAS